MVANPFNANIRREEKQDYKDLKEFSYSPLVRFFVVTLDVIYRGNTVESTNGKNHVVDHLDREITTRIVHIRDRAPNIRRRVVFLSATHS